MKVDLAKRMVCTKRSVWSLTSWSWAIRLPRIVRVLQSQSYIWQPQIYHGKQREDHPLQVNRSFSRCNCFWLLRLLRRAAEHLQTHVQTAEDSLAFSYPIAEGVIDEVPLRAFVHVVFEIFEKISQPSQVSGHCMICTLRIATCSSFSSNML